MHRGVTGMADDGFGGSQRAWARRAGDGFAVLLLCVASVCCGCATTGAERDTLTQVSTIDALLAGVYDGCATYGELARHGDFGLGTFDALDGEMIAFDGEVWRIRADGRAYRVEPSMTTPFAEMTFFEADVTSAVAPGSDFKALTDLIDGLVPNENLFYAIRVEGTFARVKTRSVPAQEKPYPPLAEVTKVEPIFNFADVRGTIVGFRSPPFVKGVGVAGYHLHFLDEGRTGGGHVLALEVADARVAIDTTDKFLLLLPAESAEFAQTNLTVDRQGELHEAETDRAEH